MVMCNKIMVQKWYLRVRRKDKKRERKIGIFFQRNFEMCDINSVGAKLKFKLCASQNKI